MDIGFGGFLWKTLSNRSKALTVTGRDTGCTCTEFGDYVMRTIETL